MFQSLQLINHLRFNEAVSQASNWGHDLTKVTAIGSRMRPVGRISIQVWSHTEIVSTYLKLEKKILSPTGSSNTYTSNGPDQAYAIQNGQIVFSVHLDCIR